MTCTLALCLIGALAVDGDTLRHEGQRLRLWGIDAPERGEAGFAAARDTLARLIDGQPLACDVIDPADRYDRPVIRCDLPDGRDLACALVGAGAAVDWPKYSGGAYGRCNE
jgi:endonuclease YncB( thermonuclease family)